MPTIVSAGVKRDEKMLISYNSFETSVTSSYSNHYIGHKKMGTLNIYERFMKELTMQNWLYNTD